MGLLDNIKNYSSLASEAKEKIKKVYLFDQRPWVIGYSGGKDSSTVVQLVINSLLEMKERSIQLNKPIYIISSDTMVETPLVISNIGNTLSLIQKYVDQNNLPVITQLVKPEIDNTFWVNLIGKGYPAPNQSFRWCTDRLKIEPSNKFIKDKISEHGEVIVLLGVREAESASRAKSIQEHSIEGKYVMKHSSLKNAYTFAPIKNFSTDDVWNYLLNNPSPWGTDNEALFKMYSDSNSGECPLIIDQETKEKTGSCGNSRFGCWVCTVVKKDKALTGFVENGENWLQPLLSFRNWLYLHRDDRSMRMNIRANGSVYTVRIKEKFVKGEKILVISSKSGRAGCEIRVIPNQEYLISSNHEEYIVVAEEHLSEYLEKNSIDLTLAETPNLLIRDSEDHYSMLGLGPYTFKTRKKMLMKLLEIQYHLQNNGRNITLINNDELKEIRRQWIKKGYVVDSVSDIYQQIYGKSLDCESNDSQLLNEGQYNFLKQICETEKVYIEPLIELLQLEKGKQSYKIKKDVSKDISKILKKDYLHY